MLSSIFRPAGFTVCVEVKSSSGRNKPFKMLYFNAMSALLKLDDLKILAEDDTTHVINVWRTFAVRATV